MRAMRGTAWPWLLSALALGCGQPPEPPPPAEPAAEPATAPSAAASGDDAPDIEEDPAPTPAPAAAAESPAAQHERAIGLREEAPARAAGLFEGACDRGNTASCLALADLLERGRGVDQDLARAEDLIRRACREGSTAACDRMGH